MSEGSPTRVQAMLRPLPVTHGGRTPQRLGCGRSRKCPRGGGRGSPRGSAGADRWIRPTRCLYPTRALGHGGRVARRLRALLYRSGETRGPPARASRGRRPPPAAREVRLEGGCPGRGCLCLEMGGGWAFRLRPGAGRPACGRRAGPPPTHVLEHGGRGALIAAPERGRFTAGPFRVPGTCAGSGGHWPPREGQTPGRAGADCR